MWADFRNAWIVLKIIQFNYPRKMFLLTLLGNTKWLKNIKVICKNRYEFFFCTYRKVQSVESVNESLSEGSALKT